MAQSRASMLVARALAPEPGARALDLCAAPGAKTTHRGPDRRRGEVAAVERHAGRARALIETCARMGVRWARVMTGDATGLELGGERFDAVLVDPPCSGLGTLQSRPDLRWRTSPERIAELRSLQRRAAARRRRRDGTGGRARLLGLHDLTRGVRWRSSKICCTSCPSSAPRTLQRSSRRPARARSFRLFQTATARTVSSSRA